MSLELHQQIRDKAKEIGFDLFGFASAGRSPESSYYPRWLEAGYAGEMNYLHKNVDKRIDSRKLEPWAKSIICTALNYNTDAPYSTDSRPSSSGWIARYAWGDDYHDTFKSMLFQLADAVRILGPEGTQTKICVDTAPTIDRVAAENAGLGWFGKNTCILHREVGSFLFIGEVVTNLELQPDTPETDHCGTCTACIDACPTEAILEPYVLDSRRCISYLTIELKGPIPQDLRKGMGTHVFGCDICQDVCPWNGKSPKTNRPEYQSRPGNVAPQLKDLLEMSKEDYQKRFRRSPVKRAKYHGVLRNAAIAAGNSGDPSLVPSLKKAAKTDPMVAEHAEWAIRKIERLKD